MDIHEKWMSRAINLAQLAGSEVGLNPNVGAVLVYKNRIIGEGYHKAYGSNHAEKNALLDVADKDKHLIANASMYVTLEPCNHQGKTGPCSQLIAEHNIKNVYISCLDPNTQVKGGGLKYLLSNNVNVTTGILEAAGQQLIRKFRVTSSKNRPYVILKYAQSADFFIGQKDQQVWLTNALTQRQNHKWRTEVDAILVGTKTALLDDPALTARYYPGRNPIRVVIDKNCTISTSKKLFNNEAKTLIFNNLHSIEHDAHRYIKISFQDNVVRQILEHLFAEGIYTLIVEGGAQTIRHFIEQSCWDEARVITTATILESGIKAPRINGILQQTRHIDSDVIRWLTPNEVK